MCEELSENSSNIDILSTPKYHCKLAGEGIEYSWGGAKRIYRRYPMIEKRLFFYFVKLAKSSLVRITKPMCRKFSSKSRICMLEYIHANKEYELKKESVEKGEKIIK